MVQIVELDDRAGDDLSIFRKAPEAGSSTREPTASATAPTSEQQPSVAAAHDRDAPQEPTTAEASSKEDTAGPNPTSDPEQDESLQEPIEAFTDEEREAMLAKADALKQEGNTLYGQGAYDEAIDKYSDALEAAPRSAKQQRAVYLANIAACDVARKQYKEAIQACTAAVDEDPTYVKAYMRRSVAQRELDELDGALNDAKKVLELDPKNSWATRTVKELEPVVQERHEKMKDEMLGKLKDLGNTILGKFGLSLDNFKAEKDPNSGGYSIKFQQGQ